MSSYNNKYVDLTLNEFKKLLYISSSINIDHEKPNIEEYFDFLKKSNDEENTGPTEFITNRYNCINEKYNEMIST